MKKLICLVLFAALFMVSCSKWGGGGNDKVVILYITANNSLSTYADLNLSELKRGFIPYSNSSDKLVVHFHNYTSEPELFTLEKDRDGNIVKKLIRTYDTDNTADAGHISQVLNDVREAYPSGNFGLILWSHATGWLPEGYYADGGASFAREEVPVKLDKGVSSVPFSFGQDEPTRKEVDIIELAEALPYKLDYIIFDCCLMGGVEVAYEFKDKTDYMLFSPTEILANGMPYATMMKDLFAMGTRDGLVSVADRYFHYYADSSYPYATVSLVDCRSLEPLAVACRNIFNECRQMIPELDMGSVQGYFRFDRHWFYDLGHFVSLLGPSEQNMKNFVSALGGAVVYKNHTAYFIDFPIAFYSGLSTYVQNPENEYLDTYYSQLKWNIDTEMVVQ